MPRKRKEEYNEYMRNYMKKKNRENKGVTPVLDNDFNPSAAVNIGKPVLNINSASELVKQTQELLKNKGSDTEDDPILKAINRYGKYVPLVMEFIKGLQGSISQYNKQDLTPKIQPPAGWLNMTAIQKLNYKYSRSEWYAAGEAYDLAMETGNMNPQINNNYVDPTYSAPQNLQQLARKYPEAPMASNAPPTPAPVAPTPTSAPVNTPSGAENPIVAELQQDNLKYINLGAEFVNRQTDEQFLDHLKNIDALVEKAKPFIPLIPVQVKGMIIQTTKEDLQTLFKEKCPAKYALIEKEKKTKKLLEIFESFKNSIK